jgi:hypothetical protein
MLELTTSTTHICLDDYEYRGVCYSSRKKQNFSCNFIYKNKTYKLEFVNVAALGCPVVPDV